MLKTKVKNKTLQIPSNLLENCQLPTHSTKTTTKVRKPSKLVSKNCINSSILRETKFDHNEKTKTKQVDRFLDLLIKGKKTILTRENSVTLTIANAVKQESSQDNFKTRAHTKPTFNDTMRMERLISVLRGEVKKEIESIVSNRMFYATSLKILKREYGNPLLISHLKLKKLFDQPQIKNQDRTALHEYQHHLKCSNTWFLSMCYYDAISSTESLAKAVKRLPNYLRQKFYESKRDYDSENVVALIEFEKWLQIRISHLFNPIANIIASQETKSNDVPPHARSNHSKILQSEDNKLTCWLCDYKHQCEMFKS